MVPGKLWREWNLTQRKCLGLIAKRYFPAALAEVDVFLKNELPSKLQSDALAFRGLVREKMGDLSSAKGDCLAAHKLSPPATYQRYTIELTLGRLSKLSQGIEDARFWYLRAVETAIEDPLTSGASAVESFLGIKAAASWNSAEKDACEKAIRQAWNLFSLPGEPDLYDLDKTLQILAESSARPLPAARSNPPH